MKKELLDKFNFLSDKPLTGENSDDVYFGHDKIAKSLSKIITQAETPFTIGLYGTWGSGKSTIIKLLTKELSNDDIHVILFDVWKYQNDSFRRQFLLESTKQLKLNKRYKKLKEKLYFEVSKNEEIFRFKYKSFLITASPHLVVLIPILILTVITVWIFGINLWKEILLLFGGVSLFGKITETFWKKAIVVDEKVIKSNVLAEAERFEEEFLSIISDKGGKYLFVFDNLDRTTHEKAIELLTTIKTFLGSENCVFLIPCDEDAIRRHVKSNYLQKYNDDVIADSYAEEYLRKFFDSIIRIPTFESLELDDYTKKQLALTKVKEFSEDSDLVWLITYEFRNNPREIKQFINTLISTLIVIQNRINDDKTFKQSILQNDIAFLAKTLIIKQRYPQDYEEIKHLALEEASTWDEIKSSYNSSENGISKFLSETSQITPYGSDVSFYLTMSASKDESRLAGWTNFLKFALDKDFESASKHFYNFIENESLKEFDAISSSYLRKNKSKQTRSQPFISTCVEMFFNNPNIKVPKQLAIQISSQLAGTLLKTDTYSDFTISKVRTLLSESVNINQNNRIASVYVNLLGITKNDNTPALGAGKAVEIFEDVSNNTDYYSGEKSKISKFLEDNYNTLEYLELFAKPKLRSFISDKAVQKYVENLRNETILNSEDVGSRLELIKNLRHKYTEHQCQIITGMLAYLYNKESEKAVTESEIKETLNNFLAWFVKKYIEILGNIDVDAYKANLKIIVDRTGQWYRQSTTPARKVEYFRVANILMELVGDEALRKSIEDIVLKPFVGSGDYDQIYSNLKPKEIEEIVRDFGQGYVQAALIDKEVFNVGKKYIQNNEALKGQLISPLINSNLNYAVDVINEIKEIPNPVQYINSIFDRINGLDANHKNIFFDILFSNKCAGDPALVDRFFSELDKVKNTDEGKNWIKKYTRGKLFNDAQKEQLKSV